MPYMNNTTAAMPAIAAMTIAMMSIASEELDSVVAAPDVGPEVGVGAPIVGAEVGVSKRSLVTM